MQKRSMRQQEGEAPYPVITTGIDRRTLLVRGSAGALGFASLGLWSSANASTETAEPKPAQPFSIGYWDGSVRDRMTDGKADWAARPFRPDVMTAHHLPFGDPSVFRAQAEVIVHGLYGASLLPKPKSLSLMAHYTIQGENGPIRVPVHAWSYTEGPHPHVNHVTRFRMPLLPESGLLFSISQSEAGRTTTRSMREIPIHLKEGDERGTIKLRPGAYFIPLYLPETGFEPAWHRYQYRTIFAEGPTPIRRLCCRTLRGVRPVEFDYLTLSISPISCLPSPLQSETGS